MRRSTLFGMALGMLVLFVMAAPAFAGGQDSGNGKPIHLSISEVGSTGQYTFTVSKFNGEAKSVAFYIVGKKDVDKDGTLIGACAPGNPTNTTVKNDTLTCTFTPPASFSSGKVGIQAAEYNQPNGGKGNYVEDNEVKEESNTVVINNGIPQNNLAEVPYAALLPALAIGMLLLTRRMRPRLG